MTPHAAAAKALRAELKAAFPGHKFSVRSRSFAGGNAVDVSCPEGLDAQEVQRVETLADKYQYGHFDGMDDSYHMSNSRGDIPQVRYVQVRVARG